MIHEVYKLNKLIMSLEQSHRNNNREKIYTPLTPCLPSSFTGSGVSTLGFACKSLKYSMKSFPHLLRFRQRKV